MATFTRRDRSATSICKYEGGVKNSCALQNGREKKSDHDQARSDRVSLLATITLLIIFLLAALVATLLATLVAALLTALVVALLATLVASLFTALVVLLTIVRNRELYRTAESAANHKT
jgi:uncharacterized membrane protein